MKTNIYESIFEKNNLTEGKKPYDPADYDSISGKHKNAGAKAIESFLRSPEFTSCKTASEVKEKVHAFIDENEGCGMSDMYLKRFFDRLDSQRTLLGAFQQAYGIYMAGAGLGAGGFRGRESKEVTNRKAALREDCYIDSPKNRVDREIPEWVMKAFQESKGDRAKFAKLFKEGANLKRHPAFRESEEGGKLLLADADEFYVIIGEGGRTVKVEALTRLSNADISAIKKLGTFTDVDEAINTCLDVSRKYREDIGLDASEIEDNIAYEAEILDGLRDGKSSVQSYHGDYSFIYDTPDVLINRINKWAGNEEGGKLILEN